MKYNKEKLSLRLSFLFVVFQLFFVNNFLLVNSTYLGLPSLVHPELVCETKGCWVNKAGTVNQGEPFLHLFDSFDAKFLVTLDSPTYTFSNLFNETEMTDQEIVRYSKNGITFKSKGYMRPVYIVKIGGVLKHAISIQGDEPDVTLMGYLSSVCLPNMVPVCLSAATNFFYIPSISNNFQLNCHNPNTHFGDQEWEDYSTPYCKFAPGDKWAGFTYHGSRLKLAMDDIEIIHKKEYTEHSKTIKKFVNLSPNEVSYTYENSIQAGKTKVKKESMSHEWSVSVTVEASSGDMFSPTSTTFTTEVGYTGVETKQLETQTAITTTDTETFIINLKPNTAVTVKQTATFEQQKVRAKVCYPTQTVLKSWSGSTPYYVGHTTSKWLNTQISPIPHLITGQLCFVGEFDLETNTYLSVHLDK